jgi:hypothetical protein
VGKETKQDKSVAQTAKKQVMTLQNKAQKVADKLTEEVIFITKGAPSSVGKETKQDKSVARI